ncbi:MAG TPA: heme ABC exporter ATP-binding protein CcmA [Mycobacteriales bacterium]|nr:heme ABC exporter ATP-binding protein CcmA [Mycobacteriales bacterium]
MLEVADLTRRFGAHTVFAEVSLVLPPGEAVVVTGPNGAGKSTLLRCVAGTDKPDGGEVRWAGRPVRETDPAVRAALAVLLDDAGLFPEMSVAEHLDLLARVHGVEDPAAAVDEVLEDVGLVPAADQLPATLSSGQRQRLLLGSCFVRPRQVLLLDEPEQRLDVAGRAWLARRLVAEKAAGVGVLLSCHDPELVETVADWVLELS